jgi:hypothetical protein
MLLDMPRCQLGWVLAAAIELRRRFPEVGDIAKARARVRTIAGWTKLPKQMSAVARLNHCEEP